MRIVRIFETVTFYMNPQRADIALDRFMVGRYMTITNPASGSYHMGVKGKGKRGMKIKRGKRLKTQV